MAIDIKRLLYSYHKLQAGLVNIQESIMREQARRLYPSCTAAYSDDIQGKGGLVNSQTERYALFNVELDDKLERLTNKKNEYEYVVSLITRTVSTLSEREQDLIKRTYFEGGEPKQVFPKMHISLSHYYHIHSTAMNGIEQCLNGGDLHMNSLIPEKKERKQQVLKNHRVKTLV